MVPRVSCETVGQLLNCPKYDGTHGLHKANTPPELESYKRQATEQECRRPATAPNTYRLTANFTPIKCGKLAECKSCRLPNIISSSLPPKNPSCRYENIYLPGIKKWVVKERRETPKHHLVVQAPIVLYLLLVVLLVARWPVVVLSAVRAVVSMVTTEMQQTGGPQVSGTMTQRSFSRRRLCRIQSVSEGKLNVLIKRRSCIVWDNVLHKAALYILTTLYDI